MLVSAYICQVDKLVSTYFLRQKIVGHIGGQQKASGPFVRGAFFQGPFFC